MTRTCSCGRDIRNDRRQRYCTLCKAADPHRNHGRSNGSKLTQMIVQVDGEGRQIGDDMQMVSMSYGREDGTSRSLWVAGPRAGQKAVRWLIRELSGPYTGQNGEVYKQIVQAFHFNWDASVIAKDWQPGNLELVYSSVSSPDDQKQLPIDRKNRYHQATIQDAIGDGAEGPLMGWDPITKLALSIAPKRRVRVEYRPFGRYFKSAERLDIHDTGTAFVGGLLDVIDKWRPELTERQHEVIEWGKRHRKGGFLDGTPEQIMEYSEAECVAAARCVRKLLNAIKAAARINIAPSKVFGSGSIAAEAFKYHRVPKAVEQDLGDSTAEELARVCYFGGLIENPVIGLVPVVDEVDINSAYPDKAVKLPCMKIGHGTWHSKRGRWEDHVPSGSVGYVLASWAVTTPSTPPFIVRNKSGRVSQPLSGYRVWVTLPEFEAAVAQFGYDIICHKSVWWEQTCSCENPFAWLQEFYDARAMIKEQMKMFEKNSDPWLELNAQQEALKLIINSCYGKLAQQRPELGCYTNLNYAAMITGMTRAQVRKETWLREAQEGTVVYQHTDSVLSIGGSPKDGGSALGAWKLEKQSTNLVIIQPGLAIATGNMKIYTNEYGETKVKIDGKSATRGCGTTELAIAVDSWMKTVDFTQHPYEWPELVIPRKMMISRRLAMARNKPELAGSFQDMPLKIHFATEKRDMDSATPMVDYPTAWQVPPKDMEREPATVNDIKQFQTSLAKRIAAGEFDHTIEEFTYDKADEHDNNPVE